MHSCNLSRTGGCLGLLINLSSLPHQLQIQSNNLSNKSRRSLKHPMPASGLHVYSSTNMHAHTSMYSCKERRKPWVTEVLSQYVLLTWASYDKDSKASNPLYISKAVAYMEQAHKVNRPFLENWTQVDIKTSNSSFFFLPDVYNLKLSTSRHVLLRLGNPSPLCYT